MEGVKRVAPPRVGVIALALGGGNALLVLSREARELLGGGANNVGNALSLVRAAAGGGEVMAEALNLAVCVSKEAGKVCVGVWGGGRRRWRQSGGGGRGWARGRGAGGGVHGGVEEAGRRRS